MRSSREKARAVYKRRKKQNSRKRKKVNMAAVYVAAGVLLASVVAFVLINSAQNCEEAFLHSENQLETHIDEEISLTVHTDNGDKEMNLHEYLCGVVSCEMPASYDEEALKAQALAARTYTAYKMIKSPCTKSDKAVICTNPGHCQAYGDEKYLKNAWGSRFEEYLKKIDLAVRETDGMIITYNGDIIQAVYTASCGGKTEDSENVFGNAVPYLRSVDSDDEEEGKNYTYTIKEYTEKLSSYYADLQITETTAKEKTQKPIRFESGRVDYVQIANAKVSGETMRKIFSLPSTMFTITFSGETVSFRCKGYGHGVGLSQVGANGYARQGMSAEEIVKHYYSGVNLENIKKFA